MGWIHQNGYDLCMQDGEYSCAMACAAMVINRRQQGTKPSEAAIKDLSRQSAGRSYTPSTKDKLKSMGGIQVMPNVVPTNKAVSGTGMENIKSILDNVHITNDFNHSTDIMTVLTSAQHDYPIVAHVVWSNNSAHYVMIDWFDSAGTKKLIIMDPAYGIVMNDASATYKPNASTSGTFSGWYIKTS